MTNLKLFAASLAATAMMAIPSAGAETLDTPVTPDRLLVSVEALTKGEAKLAKMLKGRVAGEPQKCIRAFPTPDLTVIDSTALVYKVGRTLYVNVPKNARTLDDRETLVRRTSFGSRLCNTDIVTTVDSGLGHHTGSISLGEFVPYRKTEAS